jgi:hypothetical protein
VGDAVSRLPHDPSYPYEVWVLPGRASDDDRMLRQYDDPEDAEDLMEDLQAGWPHLDFEIREYRGPGTDAFYFKQLYDRELRQDHPEPPDFESDYDRALRRREEN